MTRIVDDDPPIRTHAASQAYRDGWERVFGEKTEEPCGVCGETGHEKIEAFGATVTGCPEVPPDKAIVLPTQQAVRDYLAAGGEPSPIGWYGVITDLTPIERQVGPHPSRSTAPADLPGVVIGHPCPVCETGTAIVQINGDDRTFSCCDVIHGFDEA